MRIENSVMRVTVRHQEACLVTSRTKVVLHPPRKTTFLVMVGFMEIPVGYVRK